MKYHEHCDQAKQIQQQANQFLELRNLPANPINYAVAYEYVSQKNESLVSRVDEETHLDNFSCEMIFHDCILIDVSMDKDIVQGMHRALNTLESSCENSTQGIHSYIQGATKTLDHIEDKDVAQQIALVTQLVEASQQLLEQQQSLLQTIVHTQAQSNQLKGEFAKQEKQLYTDQLTGFSNRKGLLRQIDIWEQQNRLNKVVAITINIDNFAQFNSDFGHLIGDVVLAKVSQQIKKYVMDLGLPVRYSGEEFLILMPDSSEDTSMEMAEEIRKAIHKMRFISAKNKTKLPAISVSSGIAKLRTNEFLEDLITRSQKAMNLAKSNGRNCVIHENQLQ